ncbi:MAG: hypothetical protein VXZ72_00255 [Chlamydiota bacterium]|nr:hypothetical protein [Chlamydiota bacterium]
MDNWGPYIGLAFFLLFRFVIPVMNQRKAAAARRPMPQVAPPIYRRAPTPPPADRESEEDPLPVRPLHRPVSSQTPQKKVTPKKRSRRRSMIITTELVLPYGSGYRPFD